jgi:hypothetical protein
VVVTPTRPIAPTSPIAPGIAPAIAPAKSEPTAVVVPTRPNAPSSPMPPPVATKGMMNGMKMSMAMMTMGKKGKMQTMNPTATPTTSDPPDLAPTVFPTSNQIEAIAPSPMPVKRSGKGNAGKAGKGGKAGKRKMDRTRKDDDGNDDDDDDVASNDKSSKAQGTMIGKTKRVNPNNIFKMFVSSDNSEREYYRTNGKRGMMMMMTMSKTDNGSSKGNHGGAKGNIQDASNRSYTWKLITGRYRDGAVRDGESHLFIRPLSPRQKPHATLENWYREHYQDNEH